MQNRPCVYLDLASGLRRANTFSQQLEWWLGGWSDAALIGCIPHRGHDARPSVTTDYTLVALVAQTGQGLSARRFSVLIGATQFARAPDRCKV